MSLVCYDVSSGSEDEPDSKVVTKKFSAEVAPAKSGFRIDPSIWQTTRQLIDDVCAHLGEPSLLASIKCEPAWSLDMAYRDPNEINLSSEESDADVCSEDGSDIVQWGDGNGKTRRSARVTNDEDSQDSDAEFDRILKIAKQKRLSSKPVGDVDRTTIPRIKGELLPSELPPIDKLCIHVEEEVPVKRIGQVSSFVDCLAIVQSDVGQAALDVDTVLFDERRNSIGRVFEVFGPVPRPLYSIRFNSDADAAQSGLSQGSSVFFAPTQVQWTKTVFTDALRKMKGTDASWKDNYECPDGEQDYSDDEEERRNRARRRRDGDESEENQTTADAPSRGGKRNHRGDFTHFRGRGGSRGRGDGGRGRGDGGRGRGDGGRGRGGARGRGGQGNRGFSGPVHVPPTGPRMAWPPSAQYGQFFQQSSITPYNQVWPIPPRLPANPGIVDTRYMNQ